MSQPGAGEWRYTIVLLPEPEEGGYSIIVPSLPGCQTQGEIIEEAIAMAKDAIALHIKGLLADGEELPIESEHPQTITLMGTLPMVTRAG
jgi:antitoxin HicB